MKNFILTTAFALSVFCSQAQTTISLDKAGSLSEKISQTDKYTITNLKIIGPINGTDIILLRDMSGMDQDNKASDGKLEVLDLTDATIEKGGEPYYVSYGGTKDVEYYTVDNEMSNAMFFSCGKLKDVKLPVNVTAIGDSCFYKCEALESVTIPSTVKEIRSYAMSYTALSKFEFSEGMIISDYVLSGCSSMAEIKLPSDATSIGKEAFSGTAISQIQLPEGLKTIGEEAFSGSMLTSLTCPQSLVAIKESAFSRCKKLAEVKFNNTLEEIGKSAFSNCESLTEVDVPNSVKTMGGAFGVCTNLVKAHIPDGLTEIGANMFDRCSNLKDVNIPEGVTKIGSLAFQNNSSLPDIKFPEELQEIGKSAFKSCSSFTEIKLPASVKSIGISCFDGCENVTTVQLSPALTEIPRDAFGFCSAITEVEVPEGVETVGDMAFMYCDAMEKLTLPSTLTSIGSSSFGGNEALAEVRCSAVVPPTCGRGSFDDIADEATLYVPKDSKEAYAAADTWSDFTKIEETETTEISQNNLEKTFVKESARFNVAGQKIGIGYNGLQIIRYSDGTSIKFAQ